MVPLLLETLAVLLLLLFQIHLELHLSLHLSLLLDLHIEHELLLLTCILYALVHLLLIHL